MTMARALTFALAATALMTHIGVWMLSPDVKVWARAFYVARSFEGVALFFAVLAFAYMAGRVTFLLLAICVFGMAMESVAGVCGAVFYLGGGVTPAYEICEQTQMVTPWLLLTCSAILALVAWGIDRG